MCGPFWKSSQPSNTQDTEKPHANRRDVVKAAAGLGAAMAVGSSVHRLTESDHRVAHAQEAEGTRARSWSEPDNINTNIKLEGDGWVTLQTEFPFWALGFGWDVASGTWPAVEFGVSYDGQSWDDGYFMAARSDGGPLAADNRHHTDLFFAEGHEYIRYRTMDGEGNLVILERFQVTYIDPTDGPWEKDRGITMLRTTSANSDTLVPPTIITRAQWGANENLRFDGNSELWPSEYQTVEHAIVHHAAANYGSDGYNAVRSIYYYHCVTQGWGDIGYNYVVDVNGNIFEGRVGGANVIGGHAFEYANGSSGICVMGDFTNIDPPHSSKVALANIIAYVTRDLNPHGSKPFHSVPALPTIAAHRDVNQSSCPGNGLYDDLPWLRNQVKSILDQGLLDSQNPGGIVPGDWVRVQTENDTPLPMRSQPGTGQLVIDNIPYNTLVEVERGPLSDNMYNWYLVHFNNKQGWVPADYLLVDPPTEDPSDGYTYGQNVRVTTTTSLRSTPNGSVRATVSSGAWAFILAGATPAGGNTWFQLRTQSNGDGWVPRSAITLAPVYNPTPRFPVGSNVITTVAAPIRVRPGISQTAGGTVSAGRTLQVSVAPIAVTDRIWYGVYGGAGTGGGWIEEGHLQAGPGSITVIGNVTAPGQQFRVTEAVNMRTAPGTGNSTIATLAVGVTGTVTAGPQSASGYSWWQVRTDSNQQGWVVTNYIQQIRTGSPGELTGFGVGVTVRTNTAVNMRSDAGTGYSIVAELSSNTNGTIIDGPRVSTGFTWWRIRTLSGQVGWVAQSYLVRTSGLPPGFEIGDSIFFPTSSVRRSNPSNASSSLPAVPASTYAVVINGPREASSLVWWQVLYGSEAGWVPQSSFQAADKFTIGDSASNTGTTQIRPDINNISQIEAIPWSTHFVVISGPRFAAGRLWYRLLWGTSSGWIPHDYLTASDKFKPGDSATNIGTTQIRPDINDVSQISSLPRNTHFVVISGPLYVAGRLWYRLLYGTATGWVPHDYLATSNKFKPGDSVTNTGTRQIRPDIDNVNQIATIPEDTYFVVINGPRYVAGRLWYQLLYGTSSGWVPHDYLTQAYKFAGGDLVTNLGTRQIRPSINDVGYIESIDFDTSFVVIGGPEYVAGRLWYHLRYGDNTGWIPHDYLVSAIQGS